MFIVFWPSQSVDEDGIWDEVPINDDGRDTWPQWTVHWRPRVAESVADFGPKEVLCSTWIDILPQKLLNRLNTPNRTPETSWEDTWIQKKDVVFGCFLPAQCLEESPSRCSFYSCVKKQRCFAATEDNLFGPWQTEEQFEVGFDGNIRGLWWCSVVGGVRTSYFSEG